MRLFLLLMMLVCSYTTAHSKSADAALHLISDAEAKVIIEQQMADQAAREAQRKAELESMSATQSRVLQKNKHRVLINRVVPPQLKTVPAPSPKDTQASRIWTAEEWAAMIAAQPEHQSISLRVTVFGEDYSKILWRKPRDEKERREAPEEFEIWTNVNLNYLRPISTFDRDNIVYDYFCFIDTVTREDEARLKVHARELGYDYESRWQASPVPFTDGKAEYVVVEGEERQIPTKLYQQMDALFGYYLENEDKFKSDFLRSEALRKAREAYLKENPPQPKDVIINHWPILEGGQR